MKRTIKVNRQPPYKGGRLSVGSGFTPEQEYAVEQEMKRWNATRAFVISTCVSYALGVEGQADYRRIKEIKSRA